MASKIGIIGGNGVAATIKLMDLIEQEYTKNGAFRDCHHPEMVVWQATKAPSRSLFLEKRGESFVPEYIDITKKLKNCGCDKVCMCCNTAHWAIEEISDKAEVPFINLVEECVSLAHKSGAHHVGLVASDGCLKGKVYEKYFDQICPEIKIIYPDNQYQQMVTKAICNVKNIHRFDDLTSPENPQNLFTQVDKHLKEQGAELNIMGCTDIRVAYYNEENIDSLEVLKNLIIKNS